MSLLNPTGSNDFVQFEAKECVAVGQSLHAEYASAQPYPHIVMDDFLPADLLRRVVAEFPERQRGRYADAHSNLKTGYQREMIKSAFITNFFYALNSAQFLKSVGVS